MGHIRLSREADLVVVAPATADLMAKMAAGLADDLASTLLLATDKPVLMAPAMNPRMWAHPATRRNVAQPEGRRRPHRRARTPATWPAARSAPAAWPSRSRSWRRSRRLLRPPTTPAGRHAGHGDQRARPASRSIRSAISPTTPRASRAMPSPQALAELGARHAGQRPGQLPDPAGVTLVHVETAREMLAACEAALPADIAVCAAAVADWRPVAGAGAQDQEADGRRRRRRSSWSRTRTSCATLATHAQRPALVIGFAAETERPGGAGRAPSSPARAATGSSPTTSRRAPACSAATSNRMLLLTARRPARGLAGARQARVARRLAAGSPELRSSRRPMGDLRVAIERLPHAADLPLPAYATRAGRRASTAGRRCRPMCRSS